MIAVRLACTKSNVHIGKHVSKIYQQNQRNLHRGCTGVLSENKGLQNISEIEIS